VETLYTTRFIHLQVINTSSQRVCVFHMIIRTERKYFDIQQEQFRYYSKIESVYCAARADSM